MKKIYTFFVFCIFAYNANAQFAFSTYYQLNTSTMPQLKTAHGCGIDMFSSVKKSNYSIGISYYMSMYGYKHEPIEFVASDGSMLNTYIDVSNTFHHVSFYQRYTFGTFSGRFSPFVDAKMGWNFFRTRLYIADPEDESNCEPLEEAVLQRDNNWAAYAGGGMDVKLNGLFCGENNDDKGWCFFTLSFGYALGGTVSYMNVAGTAMANTGPHNGTHQHDTEGNTKVEPYYSSFINTQTKIVHQHHTGYVYTSPINMFQMKAGITFKF